MRKTAVLLLSLIFLSSIIASISSIAFAYAIKPDNVPPQLEKRVFIHYKKRYGKPD